MRLATYHCQVRASEVVPARVESVISRQVVAAVQLSRSSPLAQQSTME